MTRLDEYILLKRHFFLFWVVNTCSYLKYVNITCSSLKKYVVFRLEARCRISINNGMSKLRPPVIHIHTLHISTFDREQHYRKKERANCIFPGDFLKCCMLTAMLLTIVCAVTYLHIPYLIYLFHLIYNGTIDKEPTSHKSLSV